MLEGCESVTKFVLIEVRAPNLVEAFGLSRGKRQKHRRRLGALLWPAPDKLRPNSWVPEHILAGPLKPMRTYGSFVEGALVERTHGLVLFRVVSLGVAVIWRGHGTADTNVLLR